MDILIKASQFILSLSILIVLHEFGHFIPARLFGTRVEKFYLFFNPWFSIVKKKIGDTEWGIGWVPLGGYVKISGMIDESMDKEQMEKPAEPWEFRSKPAWQRLIIMLGGVIVNVIVGFVIYIMIIGVWGKNYIDNNKLTYGVYADSIANSYGIETGDIILAIDDEEIHDVSKVTGRLLLEDAETITFKKKETGEEITKELSEDIDWDIFGSPGRSFVSIPAFPVVAEVDSNYRNNQKLIAGDSIVSINGDPIKFFQDLTLRLRKTEDSTAVFGIYRNGGLIHDTLYVSNGKLGFYNYNALRWYKDTTVHYGFGGSITEGSKVAWSRFKGAVAQLKFVFSKKGSEEVGGFISIGKLFPAEWNWMAFWELTAMLSMVLAVMNVLPIPALDGGHVLFLLYEMITGREPNKKFMEYAQIVGMILLLGLLLYANGNDIFKLFK